MISFFRNHEWFKRDLPAYLFPSPTASDGSFIDIDAVSEVCEVLFHPMFHIHLANVRLYKIEIWRFRQGSAARPFEWQPT